MSKSKMIRSFNRYELKYLMHERDAAAFREQLKPYTELDPYGDDTGSYFLASLYFDTDDHLFYWEKIEGLKFRRKIRMRIYETPDKITDDSNVFVEVKQRLDKIIQKRRVVLPYKHAKKLLYDYKIPPHEDKDSATIQEIYHMLTTYQLKPTCITSYKRQALIGHEYDLGLRITFDTNVRYRDKDLDLTSKKIGKAMIPLDYVIMEVKVNDRIPYWLTELIADQNASLIRISKYCTGLEQANIVPNKHYLFA